ncbi:MULTISPECIES: site-specific integrase [Lysinibacillus]|uniref:site-specific integrase n=1 Tax=Lysinibacillus TaxID=400634 RepID=UPI00083C9795|nr:site-specific integrase [Lysinibacillus xylanilyticus]
MKYPQSEWYIDWEKYIDKNILHLKNLNNEFLIDKLGDSVVKFITKNCLQVKWSHHLILMALIRLDKNTVERTILERLKMLHRNFKLFFSDLNLESFNDEKFEQTLYKYYSEEIYLDHTSNKRTDFLKAYTSSSLLMKKWVESKFDSEKLKEFQNYMLPVFYYRRTEFKIRGKAEQKARTKRKAETDAIVPYLPQLRVKANFRWNQINRLYQTYKKVLSNALETELSFPVEFSYDEPEHINETHYFRLWSKRSFILNNSEKFSRSVLTSVRLGLDCYSAEKDSYFVEYLETKSTNSTGEIEGFWFQELLDYRLFAHKRLKLDDEGYEESLTFLKSIGYLENGGYSNPYRSLHEGVLAPPRLISSWQCKADGYLLDIEPLYVSCTFGLLAIDILTTTGARINELLQINNTKECIKMKKVKDKICYSFMAIPKGRDLPEEYYISKQTMSILQIVAKMLKGQNESNIIPYVEYRGTRKYLFKEVKPYYFQCNNRAMREESTTQCIRFLLHGLYFETKNGEPVTIKSHLLRHAFATEALQRQKIPIDIVAKLLHHKNFNTTAYYSAPTDTQIIESLNEYHDIISSYVDIDDIYLRSPESLQRELDEYTEKVGVFNKVLGGTCVTEFVCPTKMQCLGCKAKIPEPDQEDELLDVIKLSTDMQKRFNKMGLEIEARKAKEMMKQARIELQEIDLIKKYREERKIETQYKLNPFR